MKTIIQTLILTLSLVLFTACSGRGNTTTNTGATTTTTITYNGTTYGFVTSPYTGKVWLDRNLGAARVCTSFNDTACYGDYYQWGRNADGHENSISGTVGVQATDVNNTGNTFFVIGFSDWASVDVNGSQRSANWSKTDGSSVCPIGFRVPTLFELKAETLDQNVTNSATAFANFLKLPSAGYRSYIDGSMGNLDLAGFLWGSPGVGVTSFAFVGAGWGSGSSGNGLSVRCLKN